MTSHDAEIACTGDAYHPVAPKPIRDASLRVLLGFLQGGPSASARSRALAAVIRAASEARIGFRNASGSPAAFA